MGDRSKSKAKVTGDRILYCRARLMGDRSKLNAKERAIAFWKSRSRLMGRSQSVQDKTNGRSRFGIQRLAYGAIAAELGI